jgi:hypothetical protein
MLGIYLTSNVLAETIPSTFGAMVSFLYIFDIHDDSRREITKDLMCPNIFPSV